MRYAAAGLLWLMASVAAAAHPGVGIVRDSRGNIYYTDLRQVWKLWPDGKKTVVVPGVHTHELAIDADDNLYGEHLWYEGERTDKWGHYIWRLSPGGKLERIVPATEGFRKNYSFVRDRAGNMYWAERSATTHILKRAPDGTITTLAASAALDQVRWMTATPEGVIYLINDDDLMRVEPNGRIATLARDLAERSLWMFFVGTQHALMGLAADSEGNVYVAVYAGRVVKKISPQGKVSVVWRSSAMWSPTGVLATPEGDVWILESASGPSTAARVSRLRRDGTSTTY